MPPKARWTPFVAVYTWIATREQKTRFGIMERIIEVHLESQFREDLVSRERIKSIVEEIIEFYCRRIDYGFIFEQPNVLEGEAEFSEIPEDFHERTAFSFQFLEPRVEQKKGGVRMVIEIYDHTYDRLVARGEARLLLRWWEMSVRDIVSALLRGGIVRLRARGRKRQTALGEF